MKTDLSASILTHSPYCEESGKTPDSGHSPEPAPAGTPASCTLLDTLQGPADLAAMSTEELTRLSAEIRTELIQRVSKTGGHLAPSLGVVELTVAMLSVFNPENDKIVWDVGHQAYAYKMLTGRRDRFSTLRQAGGISGFISPEESPYDHFGVGHSSTSISAALGMAVARDLAKENHHVVSVIGDGSFTAGMAYEAFNNAGSRDRPFIVILNDNAMSISKNVGALSLFMSRNLSSRWVRRVKREVEGFLKSVPGIGDDLYEIARRSKHSFKNFFTPGILFEALRFNYIGAVDGHNIAELQKVLRLAAVQDEPVLVHVLTQKGRGYQPAEDNPVQFHGIGTFEPETGCITPPAPSRAPSYTRIFGETLCALAEKDERVVGITAAMPLGTGLAGFAERFPNRFFDVGIAEQHAVTFAAGLAIRGLRPFVAIYSTFLQRGYDQIVHDVCLQNLPVVFCLDRAGLVGQDGATHQGAYDIAFLRHIPEMVLFAPKDEAELQRGLATALEANCPFALRYPRGPGTGVPLHDPADLRPFPIGQGEFILQAEGGIAVIAAGNAVLPATLAAQELSAMGHRVTVYNTRFIKPLPTIDLKIIAESHDKILVVEEHALAGGLSSAILELYSDSGLLDGHTIRRIGLPDRFIKHGSAAWQRQTLGLDSEGLKKAMLQLLEG
jgi:1-deoxy-D-xylulose-5-phosphate synthase